MEEGVLSTVEGFDDTSAEPGVWVYAHARRATVVIDGADYFDRIQQAMLNARQRILLIGWDFDTRIHLTRGRRWWQKGFRRQHPSRLGSFIVWLTNHRPELEIRILKWSFGWISMALDLLRWWPHRRIDFKFDAAHPIGCSHHQKIVVIDDDFAVCGGIDMTSGRWDTRNHVENDERRKRPGGRLYKPWHDVTMMMEGDVAGALERLGRARWIRAGGTPLSPSQPTNQSVWPEGLEATFENVEIGIARTRAEYGGDRKVDEVEKLFLQQIAEAKHFIYAENQYFASRAICEAIAKRLSEPDSPEFIIVHPEGADGWVEGQAMDPARAELVRAIHELDQNDRFHLYIPYSGEAAIYVHAKLLIVDDRILRIGSANFNNRSLGLDSECDVFINCARPANGNCMPTIRALRHSLLAEHCGVEPEEAEKLVSRHGSMAAMIASLGEKNSRHLRPYIPEDPGDLLTELALRETFDAEEPEQVLDVQSRSNGLFRPGSVLDRARLKARAKLRRKRKNGQ